MFLGTSRGPGGVAADGEADALHCWTGFELFSRAEWIITAANKTREMSARVVQEAPEAAIFEPQNLRQSAVAFHVGD
jgi:hypothetical protein